MCDDYQMGIALTYRVSGGLLTGSRKQPVTVNSAGPAYRVTETNARLHQGKGVHAQESDDILGERRTNEQRKKQPPKSYFALLRVRPLEKYAGHHYHRDHATKQV